MFRGKRKLAKKNTKKKRSGGSEGFAEGAADVAVEAAVQGGLPLAVRGVAALGRAIGHGAKAAVDALT
ncbi:hypothetical protein I5Q34_06490 [Streptomyces sp. AV19]|uniref:hypothetical protein n=1 Tax=Streptomyces sp. AV19 TaxID=2793068 RepID=UPI0018FE4604|nr:hypothetical protein [Streptomyces sp. AV19]MBH1933947.1 hypothetical protein [Streptomyces sp. AV19]MDG4535570.1 hypothetical protein [Streptomyces sp. AV19]